MKEAFLLPYILIVALEPDGWKPPAALLIFFTHTLRILIPDHFISPVLKVNAWLQVC